MIFFLVMGIRPVQAKKPRDQVEQLPLQNGQNVFS